MVATILLLALTVTLFASIFFFVNTFPQPAPQPTNQFTASLTYGSSGTTIVGISVLHLAGPSVPGGATVYLYSSSHPTRFPTPFTVSSGLVGHAAVWNLGQSWALNLTTYTLTTPDNITVSLVTSTELLFRVTLPGQNPAVPPVYTNVGTLPAQPVVGRSFTVFTQISDSTLQAKSVYLNLSQVPGVPGKGLYKMVFSASNGTWSVSLPAGTTTSTGTFYAFINSSDLFNLANSIAFTITIVSTPGQLTASLLAGPSAPVVGGTVNVTAFVSNGGSSAATATMTFTAGATTLGTTTGSIPAGSTSSFLQTWTPASSGVYLLAVQVNTTGGTSTSATLNITVYPTIVLVAHNVVSGTRTAFNESAYLAEELTAAGYPFKTVFVSCTSALTAAVFTGSTVAIVDFGSATGGGCPTAASSNDQSALTGLASTSLLVVGTNAFSTTTCATYGSSFFGLFSLTSAASGTCMVDGAAATAVAYTAAAASGLRSDGIPASLTFNKTLGTSSAFVPYDTFSKGATNSFLKVGGAVNGAFKVSGSVHNVAIAGDPALLTTPLPAPGGTWGSGAAGTDVLYNVMGFVTGLASSSSTGRALSDFSVAQGLIVGQSHTRLSTIFVGLRENGPTAGIVSVTLYVNGTVALNGGTVVASTITLSGAGSTAFVVLSWEAPSTGPYTLSLVVSTNVKDYYSPNDQIPMSVLNQAVVFT